MKTRVKPGPQVLITLVDQRFYFKWFQKLHPMLGVFRDNLRPGLERQLVFLWLYKSHTLRAGHTSLMHTCFQGMICQSPDGKIMCLAIFVPFSSFFLGTGRTQGLIWADDPYLPHCPRLLKHWISGLTCLCLWQLAPQASEKNAPRNPWIIVFFSQDHHFPNWNAIFLGISRYIPVSDTIRHLYGPMRCYIMWSPSLKDESNRFEIVLEQDNHLLLAHGGCFDPIDQIGSVARYGPCFHMFSPRHGEKMRLVADTGDIIKENGIIVS